jgi:hypothetical protein
MSGILDRSPCFIADFRPQTVNGLLQCPNLGQAAGAPRYCVLGDGSTAGTIPVPNASGRFGASFTGTQYVNTGIVDRYDWTSQFSLYCVLVCKPTALYKDMISSYDFGLGTGILFRNSGANIPSLYLSGATFKQYAATSAFLQPSMSIVGTSTGKLYVGSNSVAVTTSGSVSGSLKNGKPFLVGSSKNGATAVETLTGTIYAAGIFDGLLTPISIAELDTLVRSKINSWYPYSTR